MGWNIAQRANADNEEWELVDDFAGKPRPSVVIGRGTTDNDITYIGLRNSAGTLIYISPNTAGTGVDVSSTKP